MGTASRISLSISALRLAMRRMLRVGRNSLAITRTETQLRHPSHAGPVGDRLAAAEAALGEDVVEFGSALADEMGEDLPLLLAGKVRTGRGGRQVELRRVARVLGHGANRLLPARSGHRQSE